MEISSESTVRRGRGRAPSTSKEELGRIGLELFIERGFENVTVDFSTAQGPMRVLDDVSFSIGNGEFVSVIGPSGCGKTTMMNIVGGFVQPTSGRVLLDGQPVAGPGPDRGVIFQEYGVFPWLTVRQNIEFGLKLKAGRVDAAMSWML